MTYDDTSCCDVRCFSIDLALDGDEGEEDTGHFSCDPSGTFVGNQNFTFIVNEAFGRYVRTSTNMLVTGTSRCSGVK